MLWLFASSLFAFNYAFSGYAFLRYTYLRFGFSRYAYLRYALSRYAFLCYAFSRYAYCVMPFRVTPFTTQYAFCILTSCMIPETGFCPSALDRCIPALKHRIGLLLFSFGLTHVQFG